MHDRHHSSHTGLQQIVIYASSKTPSTLTHNGLLLKDANTIIIQLTHCNTVMGGGGGGGGKGHACDVTGQCCSQPAASLCSHTSRNRAGLLGCSLQSPPGHWGGGGGGEEMDPH